MLISPAFAQAAGAAGGGFSFISLMPMFAIVGIFYFLLIRPQQQKAKQHRAKIDAIRRGDRIVTGGGILGVVTKAADAELTVEIAEGVRVSVARATVADVITKPDPAARDKAKDQNTGTPKGESAGGLLGGLLGGKK